MHTVLAMKGFGPFSFYLPPRLTRTGRPRPSGPIGRPLIRWTLGVSRRAARYLLSPLALLMFGSVRGRGVVRVLRAKDVSECPADESPKRPTSQRPARCSKLSPYYAPGYRSATGQCERSAGCAADYTDPREHRPKDSRSNSAPERRRTGNTTAYSNRRWRCRLGISEVE